jgi:Family of unknown function (DUF5675)
MNLTLTRQEYREDGIFSILTDENGNVIAHTLEHAYDDGNGGFAPKIPDGTFSCVRGPHRLDGMTADFTTFEITGVAGHVNLLFHWGNWTKDSEGCILVGEGIAQSSQGQMITNSKATWQALMDMEAGNDSFTLTVVA